MQVFMTCRWLHSCEQSARAAVDSPELVLYCIVPSLSYTTKLEGRSSRECRDLFHSSRSSWSKERLKRIPSVHIIVFPRSPTRTLQWQSF